MWKAIKWKEGHVNIYASITEDNNELLVMYPLTQPEFKQRHKDLLVSKGYTVYSETNTTLVYRKL